MGARIPGTRPETSEECELTASPEHSKEQSLTESAAWQLLLELQSQAPQNQADRIELLTANASIPLIDLYLPLCLPRRDGSQILGHLGQSIDGYIATASGDSTFVNDRENIRHLHRLRALHDAVIVGAGTIAADNPRLTTRLVSGPNPVRVVLDPRRRLPSTSHVFTDGAAPTLLIAAEGIGGRPNEGQAQVLFIPTSDGALELSEVVHRLAERGLRRLFVEGGGTTVSSFFDAKLLDRLQIAIAPVLTGRGKPGLRLAPNDSMGDCARPRHRVFAMGEDLLFDCDLRAEKSIASGPAGDRAEAIRSIRQS